MDTEAVRERRIHLERLTRLLDLLLLAEVLDRAQVVKAVGELDEDYTDVLGHRNDHLPVVLRLRLLAALELDARQLGDAVDEPRDLVAELGADLVELRRRVLDDVMEERGRDRLLVEAELGADLRRAPRVVDERLAGTPLLPLVRGGGEAERAREELAVDLRVVRGDLFEQLVDEVLMRSVSLENGHESSVLRGFGHESSPFAWIRGRRRRADTEPVTTLFRNRRQERKAAQLARLLLALDSIAGAERPWRPRRVARLSVGASR